MKCPICKFFDDKVVDSRLTEDGQVVRRRRECLKCGKRFTSYERIEDKLLRVVKKDGSRSALDRTKIVDGILKACEKRPVSAEQIDNMVSDITGNIREQCDKEVSSKYIGELVMDRLKGIDKIAYVRFASVYRDFKDINEFMDEINQILK